MVELHTGTYCNATGIEQEDELLRLKEAAIHGHKNGLAIAAGHGLHFKNLEPVAMIPVIREYNIGHAIISRAIFVGLKEAVDEIMQILYRYRTEE